MSPRKFGFLIGLPALLFLAGGFVSAAAAQETSEQSKSDQEKSARSGDSVKTEGQIVISGTDGKTRVFRLKKGEGEGFVWVSGDDEQEGEGPATGSGDAKKKRIAIYKFDDDGNGVWTEESGDGQGEARSVFRLMTGDKGDAGRHFVQDPEVIAQLAAQVGGYMIGVSCEPVSETLASQLGLEKGLVVVSVTGDAPASGKLEAHDIITHTDGNAIGEIDDLIKAVQAAGEADSEMKLTVLRKGKSLEVAVKPVKREMRAAGLTIEPGAGQWAAGDLKLIAPEINTAEGILLESVGPGVFRFDAPGGGRGVVHSTDALKAEIEALRKQIEELSGRLDKDDK